jgi:hypothetical protein
MQLRYLPRNGPLGLSRDLKWDTHPIFLRNICSGLNRVLFHIGSRGRILSLLSLKFTSTVAPMSTGWPSFRPGRQRHWDTARRADSKNRTISTGEPPALARFHPRGSERRAQRCLRSAAPAPPVDIPAPRAFAGNGAVGREFNRRSAAAFRIGAAASRRLSRASFLRPKAPKRSPCTDNSVPLREYQGSRSRFAHTRASAAACSASAARLFFISAWASNVKACTRSSVSSGPQSFSIAAAWGPTSGKLPDSWPRVACF